jgi:hypothetical protein
VTLTVGSLDGYDTASVQLPDAIEWRDFAASPSLIWCWMIDAPVLLVIDPADLEVREVPVRIDTAPYAPELFVPALDLATHEQAQLARVRLAFFGDSQGRAGLAIAGVSFESVDLAGQFPYTEVVALFSIEDHRGRQFGRRWRLYDDLGRVVELGYFDVFLMEDVETGHADRVLAQDGNVQAVVWI